MLDQSLALYLNPVYFYQGLGKGKKNNLKDINSILDDMREAHIMFLLLDQRGAQSEVRLPPASINTGEGSGNIKSIQR